MIKPVNKRYRYSSVEVALWHNQGVDRVMICAKLKMNLISFDTLLSKNFHISIEASVLKDVFSALVVMKGTRQNNLYFLHKKIVFLAN